MLNSARNADVWIWFDLCCSASGWCLLLPQHLCSSFPRLSAERVENECFPSRMREPPPSPPPHHYHHPPEVSCFLLCVRLPVINDCSASLTDTATTKTAEKTDKKTRGKKGREGGGGGGWGENARKRRGGNKRQHAVQVMPELEPEFGLTALGEFEGEEEVRGGGKRKKKKGGSHERGTAGARPGLEARLCLCLGLIDFQENCSRPLPSSLMKPSGIRHPTTRPTPALQRSSLPPSSCFCPPPSFPLRHTLASAQAHALSHQRKYTHAYTGTDLNYLLYTSSKQRISKARVPRRRLCMRALFGILFGRIFALSPNKEKK